MYFYICKIIIIYCVHGYFIKTKYAVTDLLIPHSEPQFDKVPLANSFHGGYAT